MLMIILNILMSLGRIGSACNMNVFLVITYYELNTLYILKLIIIVLNIYNNQIPLPLIYGEKATNLAVS